MTFARDARRARARVRRRSIAMRVVGLLLHFFAAARPVARARMTSLASCDRPETLARAIIAVNERPRDSDRSRGRPEASTRREGGRASPRSPRRNRAASLDSFPSRRPCTTNTKARASGPLNSRNVSMRSHSDKSVVMHARSRGGETGGGGVFLVRPHKSTSSCATFKSPQ